MNRDCLCREALCRYAQYKQPILPKQYRYT